jgi:hypothetical protein
VAFSTSGASAPRWQTARTRRAWSCRAYLDEHQQAEAEPVRIEPRAISLDETIALQPLQPLADRSRRQPDRGSASRHWRCGHRLKDREDFAVNLVDIDHL